MPELSLCSPWWTGARIRSRHDRLGFLVSNVIILRRLKSDIRLLRYHCCVDNIVERILTLKSPRRMRSQEEMDQSFSMDSLRKYQLEIATQKLNYVAVGVICVAVFGCVLEKK